MADINIWQSRYFIILGIVVISLILLLLAPFANQLAQTYFFFLIAGVVIMMGSFSFGGINSPFGFFVIVAEEDASPEKRFLLQNFLSFDQAAFASIILGILLGIFYTATVLAQRTPFIAIPNFFSIAPIFIPIQLFDVYMTSFVVGVAEELVWVGVMFPLIWNGFKSVVKIYIGDETLSNIVSLIPAALATGLIASLLFHAFVFQANQFAFFTTTVHFTTSALIAGTTGFIFGGTIAHIIHNAVAKVSLQAGQFAVVPFQSFQAGG